MCKSCLIVNLCYGTVCCIIHRPSMVGSRVLSLVLGLRLVSCVLYLLCRYPSCMIREPRMLYPLVCVAMSGNKLHSVRQRPNRSAKRARRDLLRKAYYFRRTWRTNTLGICARSLSVIAGDLFTWWYRSRRACMMKGTGNCGREPQAVCALESELFESFQMCPT